MISFTFDDAPASAATGGAALLEARGLRGVYYIAAALAGCEGLMVRVTPFQKSCQEVVALFPEGSTLAANLSGVPLYNLGGNQGQAMLVSSGATCVVTCLGTADDIQISANDGIQTATASLNCK